MTQYRKVGGDPLLCEAIVGEIEQMVVGGQLIPGDVLPPQDELADRFGVSRTVIREATKVLSAKQLVTVRRGVGMVISYPSTSTVTASLGLLLRLGQATRLQLTELRRFIEPQMAFLAAQRGSQEQIDSVKEIEGASRASLSALARPSIHSRTDQVAGRDLAFHQAIWTAAGNDVATAVLESIVPLLRESLATTYNLPQGPEVALADHRAITEAIATRNAEEARRRMDAHLFHTMEQLASSGEEMPILSEEPPE